jgi:hypothetical protein
VTIHRTRLRRGVRLDRFEIAVVVVLVLGSLALLSAPFHHTGYRGEGTFRNNTGGRYGTGSRSRYEVSFGQVDLSEPRRSTFAFTGLPEQDFIIGLRVSPGKDRLPTEYLLGPVVGVRLERADGSVVVNEIGQLGQWVWELSGAAEKGLGPSFVYRRGETDDIPTNKPGTVTIKRTGEKADSGWGTYFHPTAATHYRLTFEVKDGSLAAKHFHVELVMHDL